MASTVASRKAKGRLLQKLIAESIQSAFNLDELDVKSTPMGVNGSDVQLSKLAADKFPFSIEAKNRKSFQIYSIFEQAKSHISDAQKNPLLVIKQNRSKPLAVIDFDLFIKMAKCMNELTHKASE